MNYSTATPVEEDKFTLDSDEDTSDDNDPDKPQVYALRGLDYYVWSREAVQRQRGGMGSDMSESAVSSNYLQNTSASSSASRSSVSCSCARHRRRQPSIGAGDDGQVSMPEFDDDDEEEDIYFPSGVLGGGGAAGPVGVRPYQTDMSLEDTTGAVEPLHILRKVLVDMRCARNIREHRVLIDRVRAALTKNERSKLLRVINHITLFEAASVEYMRGCRYSQIETASVKQRRYPLARVLYWLCYNPLHTQPLGNVYNKFILVSNCHSPECVNPQHYSHVYKRGQDFNPQEPVQIISDDLDPDPLLKDGVERAPSYAEAFDRILRLAAADMNTPIALTN